MISHHHKCIFVHIPKTGGQSVENVFLDELGLDWKTRAPLLMRKNLEPRLGPLHLAHLTASEYTSHKYVPQEMFDAYYTFSFVRDPWARVGSFYRYLGYADRCHINTFVEDHLAKRIWKSRFWFVRPQVDYVDSADGTQLVDFVGRFERIQEDFAVAAPCANLATTDLPHKNRFSGSPPRSVRRRMRAAFWGLRRSFTGGYESVELNAQSMRIIDDLYGVDMERFGYSAP